jgi:PAS domain S-box-containing protein
MAKLDSSSDEIDYKRLFDSLPNPYIAFLPDDPVFTIVAENEAHAKVALGTTANSIGKPTFDVYPDNSEKYKQTGVSDLLESFRKVIKTQKPDTMPILKYDVKGPDGGFVEKWWRVTHYPVFDKDNKLTLFYQATEDITEEVLYAQKFELAQSMLDSALGIGLVSTWSWNIHTDTVIGDKNLARSFGVEPDEAAKGLPLRMFTNSIHKEDQERVIAAIQESVEKNTDFEQVYRTVTKIDGTRWVIARGKLESNVATQTTYLLGVIVDITESKEAESELETTKSMFDALFESTILSIALADLDGNILRANKTFLKTFGYTRKEFNKGFNSSQITPAKSRKITAQFYETVRLHGEAEPVEKEYIRKDGTPIPMLLGAAMLPGSSKEFMAFMLDISENKELKALNAAKDEFIGMASHQLRTPATIVKQYVSLLRSGFGGELNPKQQVFADKAYKSNERQLNIVNDLLKTAQIDSKLFILKKEYVTVTDLVEQAVSELGELLNRKQQSLVISDTPTPIKVYVDKTELNLVLVNLIENASKYSPDKSKIKISVALKDKLITISVIDQGVGLDKDDTPRIFQKFTRIDNELSDTVSGSGLGLYWVDQIVKLHGGSVKVKSTPRKGSSFVVSLPYER